MSRNHKTELKEITYLKAIDKIYNEAVEKEKREAREEYEALQREFAEEDKIFQKEDELENAIREINYTLRDNDVPEEYKNELRKRKFELVLRRNASALSKVGVKINVMQFKK